MDLSTTGAPYFSPLVARLLARWSREIDLLRRNGEIDRANGVEFCYTSLVMHAGWVDRTLAKEFDRQDEQDSLTSQRNATNTVGYGRTTYHVRPLRPHAPEGQWAVEEILNGWIKSICLADIFDTKAEADTRMHVLNAIEEAVHPSL